MVKVAPMSDWAESIGLIAGNRALPLEFAKLARRAGISRIVAVAFEGETEPALAELVDEIVWLKVGQLTKLIKAFSTRGIRRCVMLGQITPKTLFELRPDLRAMRLLLKLKERNAHSIFGAVAAELAREGIELIEATPWLKPVMPGAGFALGPRLTPAQRADVGFGFRIAKQLAGLDIGQTVVVKAGTVLAVEAFEGTDACIARGGALAGGRGGAVVVKVAKRGHDMRFDIPCIGARTLETCAANRIGALAFEAEKTILLEQQDCARLADRYRIAVAAVAGAE
ncbi:MAG: UDP-2,3-diacylglucosamine diphosphatase LpxI [Verrucomicrobiales bacterium]|nr:UDP-2,3-diacylglucosamine diphosphatase LpxI [Verrucomicrobiales bacterium]